jgi:hypothetical protein
LELSSNASTIYVILDIPIVIEKTV